MEQFLNYVSIPEEILNEIRQISSTVGILDLQNLIEIEELWSIYNSTVYDYILNNNIESIDNIIDELSDTYIYLNDIQSYRSGNIHHILSFTILLGFVLNKNVFSFYQRFKNNIEKSMLNLLEYKDEFEEEQYAEFKEDISKLISPQE